MESIDNIIDNLNTLIDKIGIKKKHIAKRAGIDEERLIRILNKEELKESGYIIKSIAIACGSNINRLREGDFMNINSEVCRIASLNERYHELRDELKTVECSILNDLEDLGYYINNNNLEVREMEEDDAVVGNLFLLNTGNKFEVDIVDEINRFSFTRVVGVNGTHGAIKDFYVLKDQGGEDK